MPEKFNPYAGTIEYHPGHILSDAARKLLRQQLVMSGLVKEPENGEILIDWMIPENDSAGMPLRQIDVLLYLDGGDAETPACIFYRLDKDRVQGSTHASIHIPSAARQPELLRARRWWEDPSGKKLDMLVSAITDLVYQPVWEAL
jgi:hypothetical protein